MRRFAWKFVAALLSLVLCAALPGHARAAAWSTTDLKTNAQLPAGIVVINGVTVAWQVGNYMSGNLRIFGLICSPTSISGPHPVAILNHGLAVVYLGIVPVFPAIEKSGWTGCTNMAAAGWFTAISTYRGEIIGSAVGGGLPAPYQNWWGLADGALELCGGEVDDVLALLAAVKTLPNANPSHVLMWGHSHGSCITERAIERGAQVQIAVSLDGPTDFTTWSNNNPVLAPTPAAQHERSSAFAGNDPAKLAGPQFLRIHAEGDTVVTPDQGCELISKLPGGANYYLNSNVSPPGVYWGQPKECAAFPLTWKKGQLLPDETVNATWVSPTFLMYSGLSHTGILYKSWPEFWSFVNQTAKGQNWGASIPNAFSPLEN